MNEATIAHLKKLENLTIEARELDLQIKAIKEAVMEDMPKDAKVETANGTFTVESRKKWTYTAHVKNLEATLKEETAREQADGSATYAEGEPYLVYREKKS